MIRQLRQADGAVDEILAVHIERLGVTQEVVDRHFAVQFGTTSQASGGRSGIG